MEKIELARLFYERMWNNADFELVENIIDPEYHPSDVSMPEKGPALLKKEIKYFRSIFPDLQYQVVDFSEKDNKIWIRYKGTGTHKGKGWGFEPNGKKIEFEASSILTIQDNKIVDAWRNYCLFDIFSRLGHIPAFWEIAEKLN